MRLYYLSPAAYALSNLALQRLKISRLIDLNDPFELLAVDLQNQRYREAFTNLKQELNTSKGLICFSGSWSNPLLWGHYAERHTGIALGFDVADHLPVKVIYKSARVRVNLDTENKTALFDSAFVDRLLRTKFADWKYEEEYRIFADLDHTTIEAGMYFQDFNSSLRLAEVILGPKCEIPIDRVRMMLGSIRPIVKVLKARMAFRTFRVIEDRSFR